MSNEEREGPVMKKLIAGGLMGALGVLVFASTALASSHHPTGEFSVFAECPHDRATITDCVYSVTNGGSVTIGNKTVPIKNPVTLQGGFEGEVPNIKFYGAENGDTLSKTAQPVPGGLTGIVAPTWWPKFLQNWFNKGISEGLTGVDAIVELTGPTKGLTNIQLNTENLIFAEGTALQLPVKVKLDNALLGSNCYIASNSSPMVIPLTTGVSGSLEGFPGVLSFNGDYSIITTAGAELVNNTFTAPAASGCGGLFSLFVDPLVNTILGTPAGSGKNFATLEGDLKDSQPEYVKASE
jgi:hypothetical protein